MKTTMLCVSLVVAFACPTFAADTAPAEKVQTGRMSTVHLLATGRGSQSAPDAMRFLFMVTRTPGTSGAISIKETRDFLIGGESYQEKSQAQLGRRIEPSTSVDSAEGFFAKQPGARRLAPETITGAQIVSITIAGAPLTTGAAGEVKLNVGFNKEVEPFTFAFNVPGANVTASRTGPTPAQGVSLAGTMSP